MKKTIAGGVWPVMITPFTEDNRIDYDAVLRIIEWYDKNGVDGIFAVCQSSEMFELSPQERPGLPRVIGKKKRRVRLCRQPLVAA